MTFSFKQLGSLLVCLILAVNTYGETIYVKANATGSNTGESWANAFTQLNTALEAATSGDQIWVAAGTYYPTTGSDRNISFEIPNGVSVIGGFPNTGNPTVPNPSANLTTLSGDIDQDGSLANNSYTIIYTKDVNTNTVVDGFTITGGNADAAFTLPFPVLLENGGGAWYNESSNFSNSTPSIKNCNFVGNNAGNRGGAIYSKAGVSGNTNYIIANCIFQSNNADEQGGAIYNAQSGSNSECNPNVTNTNFISNTAGTSGGAIYNNGTFFGEVSGIYTNCNFNNNITAQKEGGAVFNNGYFEGNASPIFDGCNFLNNAAPTGSGGAIYTDASSNGVGNFKLLNAELANNTSLVYGGAVCNIISNGGEIKPIIANALFKENSSTNGGASYSRGAFGSNLDVIFSNCVFYKNDATIGGAIYQNETGPTSLVTTMVANSIFEENTAGFSETFHLTGPSTIGLNNSIFDKVDCLELVEGEGNSEADCNGGNIFNQDPLFVNASSGDFHLQASSPGIDAGNNANVPAMITLDLDGNPRIAGGIVDIGIFEQVNTTADSDGDGILDINDNCPITANPDQTNADGDSAGAACDCDDTPSTGASCTTGCSTFYADNDGDGFGDPSVSVTTCVAPNNFVANNQDFNDNDDTLFPNAPELCDGKDNNNNGQIDEGTDDDNDGVCNEDDICPNGDDNLDTNNNNIPDDCESQITLNCPADIMVEVPQGGTALVTWDEPTGSTTCNGGGTGEGICTGADISGFTLSGSFNNSDYYFADNSTIWTAAQAFAESVGGYLVVINDQAENDFVQSIIGSEIIHIGINDAQTEGTFEWVNGDPVSFTNFEGTPSGEDYGIMLFWNGQWATSGDYTKSYLIEVPCGGGGGGGLTTASTTSTRYFNQV